MRQIGIMSVQKVLQPVLFTHTESREKVVMRCTKEKSPNGRNHALVMRNQ